MRNTPASMRKNSTHTTQLLSQMPVWTPRAMFVHSMPSHTTVETENATDANWSTASEPTRRMPSGEKRRSTMRNTATVGTPIVRIQSMPELQTEPNGMSTDDTGTSTHTEKNDTMKATSQTPRRATSRIVNGPMPYCASDAAPRSPSSAARSWAPGSVASPSVDGVSPDTDSKPVSLDATSARSPSVAMLGSGAELGVMRSSLTS